MQDQDLLHRFVFENTPIRGNIVHLDETFNTALRHQHCPPVLRKALGELMVASVMLAATLKMQGALILQVQGKGPLSLLVVECNGTLSLRATAKWSGELEGNFIDLVGEGRFFITLDPKDGRQAYQGIVPLEGDTISEILQNYMQRSEQIDTRIWLACDGKTAGGMLIQKLPDQPEQDSDAWQRAGILAETVEPEELLGLSSETLLRRLFHEEDLRLFEPQPIQFRCTCSRQSVGNMLKMLGEEEVHGILEERGNIEIICNFCNTDYVFDKVDAEQLLSNEIVVPGTSSRH
jgi:molecular chaperone Hsp33